MSTKVSPQPADRVLAAGGRVNAESILHGAIGVLAQRGRCFSQYEYAEKVCVMGALAVASGREPDYWIELQEVAEGLSVADEVLIAAARYLAAVVVPALGDVSVEDLCVLVGHWHDGERRPGDVRPKNSEVFAALHAAATLAGERIEVSA